MVLSEDSPQENASPNHYSSILPPASPEAEEDTFSTTYFEEKVPVPGNIDQVLILAFFKHLFSVYSFDMFDISSQFDDKEYLNLKSANVIVIKSQK